MQNYAMGRQRTHNGVPIKRRITNTVTSEEVAVNGNKRLNEGST